MYISAVKVSTFFTVSQCVLLSLSDLSEPHDCQRCCLSFSSLEEHQQHIQEFHPKEFHKCPTCSKVFTSAALLDKHKSTHTGAKPYSCELCNKSYQVGVASLVMLNLITLVQTIHELTEQNTLMIDINVSPVSHVFFCCHSNCQACGTTTGPTTPMCLPTTPVSSRLLSSVTSASSSFPAPPV